MACFAKSCKNIKRLLPVNSGITFHRFPADDFMYGKWLKAIGRDGENKVRTPNMFLCSEHFSPEDFDYLHGMRRIKKLAIPLSGQFLEQSVATTSHSFQSPSVIISPSKSTSSGSNSSKGRTKKVRIDDLYYCPKKHNTSPCKSISSGSSTLSVKRKRVKLDHPYVESPTRYKLLKQKYIRKYVEQSKKLYTERRRVKQLKIKVNSLKEVLKDLKLKSNLSTDALEYLKDTFDDLPVALMSRMLKASRTGSVTREKYPEILRNFALTLNFYSAKAYNYVRNKFNLALPHPSVLRKWSASVECEPGFLSISFDVLKMKADEAKLNNKQLLCSLMLDEMDIRKQIDFDGQRNWGYVNLGVDLGTYDTPPAQEALVLMVVALNASWKIPIAYFLIKSLTGAEKANLIKETLIRLGNIGIPITSVTCDGPTANFKMFKDLGCTFTPPGNMIPFFQDPNNSTKKIYAIFDACHMLKLIRNCLGDLQVLVDNKNREIKWYYIKKLHEVQEEETLVLANKLKKSHLEFRRQKMKVNLAAQTLSNSVAEAINYLAEDLQHPAFIGCEATVDFIKIINILFDILNSRYSWAPNYKAPLRENNFQIWQPFLLQAINYLIELKDIAGNYLWTTPRKTPILGFVATIVSVSGIFDDYVKTGILNYLLTYKLSQDHLELFFCSIRSRNGWNNNPSALQFMQTMRRLLLHCDISSANSNCRVLDCTSVLSVSNAIRKFNAIDQTDLLSIRRANGIINIQNEEEDLCPPNYVALSEYSENVVTYMSGYVIRMLQRTVHCEDCVRLLTNHNQENANERSYTFLKRRNLGGLISPSKFVQQVCVNTELYIRQLMYVSNNQLPSSNLLNTIMCQVSNRLYDRIQIFALNHEEHGLPLSKEIIYAYCKIRLHNLAKKFTTTLQGSKLRNVYNKLILFNHQ